MIRVSASPDSRVWALTAALGAVAAVLLVTVVAPMDQIEAGTRLPWPLLVALFAASEVFVVHMTINRNAHSLSLSEIPLVLGMAFTAPVPFVFARVTGAALALILHRRQTGTKLAFNLTSFLLEACLAVTVFHLLLGSSSPVRPQGWFAALVALLVTNVVSALAITTAMALTAGHLDRSRVGHGLGAGALALAGNTTFALVSVIALDQDPWSVVLLVVVAGILFASYRAYTSLRQGYARLEMLYGFTRAVSGSVEAGPVTAVMLNEARHLLRAEVAEMRLQADRDQPAIRLVVRADGTLDEQPAATGAPAASTWWAPALEGRSVVLPRASRDDGVRSSVREGLKDAMAVPLRRENEVLGVVIVANRLDEVTTFDGEDLKLFEVLASHAGVALENARLVDALRMEVSEREHQALHDALTELPNRRLFATRVEEALASPAVPGGGAAVLFVDLNRFKEINDTLGHHTGDALLRQVGARFQAITPAGGTVARLGGDEFAILLPGLGEEPEARRAATAIGQALTRPFVLSGITLDVDACIGVALHPRHGDTAPALMQRADVALYTAKARHADVEMYEPAQHEHSARRLAMVSELRVAIEEERLEVHYQPKLELSTGRVVGAEALLRWDHPQHGPVPPDEFVALAEHTGLIRPLTRFVLERAVARSATWRRAGLDLGIAVNLSVRSLLDQHLPDDVAGVLERHGLPARHLTLEITENSIMSDVERSLAMLERLHSLGVRLSIDDFGTGHSSLTYLKRLSVDEVKIDKSFVLSLAKDRADESIVRSTIDLGHNLGLLVVAEGVETSEAWDGLVGLRCDVAQGYYMSRPVPADTFEAFVRDRLDLRWSGRPAADHPVAARQPSSAPGAGVSGAQAGGAAPAV
jgi:diguanylate cyclase (GGDEF)-like protein